MSRFDPERLLTEPIYALNFQVMVGDLEDFLDTSERNIEQQYHLQCAEIQRKAETEDLPDGYREHLQVNAQHRFKVSLPLRVRYGALVGLTTTVEWAMQALNESLCSPLDKSRSNQNPTVHALTELNARTRLGLDEPVHEYDALVQIRNCITHAAGIVKYYRYPQKLTTAIRRLEGFSIDSWHFIGQHVCIQRGALNRYIDRTGQLVVAIHRACYEQGLVTSDTRPRSDCSSDTGYPIV